MNFDRKNKAIDFLILAFRCFSVIMMTKMNQSDMNTSILKMKFRKDLMVNIIFVPGINGGVW